MKLAYLARSIIPSRTANSIHVMKMCQAFAINNSQVILLTPNFDSSTEKNDDLFAYYGVENYFNIRKLPLPAVRSGTRLYGLIAALKAKSTDADIAYGRCLQSCFFSSLLGLSVTYEAHKTLEGAGRITRKMFAYMVRSKNFRQLVVISDALAKHYHQQYHIPQSLITVAHDGADEIENLSQIIPVHLPGKNQFKVGYVGHLYPGKGMEIVSELAKACSWADFHIIGGRDSDIARWKLELENLENVYFHGFVPHAKTEQYRQACDVLIAPYLRNVSTCGGGDIGKWMSPLKIFEYMASGKAILTSDLPVLREVLENQNTALLCDPESLNDWIQSLVQLKDNNSLRLTLGSQAQSLFKTTYTWKARAEKILAVIT